MRVRLFAALRDLAGASALEVDASDVGELLDGLATRFGPEFARIASAGTVILDGDTVGRDRSLQPADEVALLPPVSGGGTGIRASEHGLATVRRATPAWHMPPREEPA